MHQTRTEVSKKLPLPRKGTKYVARSLGSLTDSVPVVVAVRDMLKLARTAKEVKKMIHNKALKINNTIVKDYREPIYILNIFHADKDYLLSFLPTGRFTFEEHKGNERPCKIINKKILKNNKIQLNLHDGSNVITDKQLSTQDTIYLDDKGKLSKQVPIDKGKSGIIISGKYVGRKCKISEVEPSVVKVQIDGAEGIHPIEKRRIVVL